MKTLILILLTTIATAQERLSFVLQANPDFNVSVIAKMNGNQLDNGYLTVSAEFEYTENYKGYLANGGFTFNKFSERVELMPYLSCGIIDTKTGGYLSYGGGVEVGYKLNDRFKLVSTGRYRKEFNWFVGIEIKV